MSLNFVPKRNEDIPEYKKGILDKLLTVFDLKTAIGFVNPKPFEARRHLTLEDLLNVNNDQRDKHFQRLRSMEYYQTITQSLSRLDLEASYQAFIRGQIARKPCDRDKIEQIVRTDADINALDYCFKSPSVAASHPLQAHLLFHSSKLNEHKANLIQSASANKTLKQLNENLHLRQFFPETFVSNSSCSRREKDSSVNQQIHHQQRSMHVECGDRKYHVKFLKDFQSHANLSLPPTNHGDLTKTIESFSDEGISSRAYLAVTSDVHRESYPPLSLSALEECRPTLMPTSSLTSSTRSGKPKDDFIWEKSIVSSKHE
ncbi:unnamed protein product [Adineta ricciae]|uniref:Uncharacterized protein n=1 Tax=Adineta ricciae TaxID=249248 RepID=A0A814RNN2_ADIRI|nr:unnamed protein product [Adineta ricciae]